MAHPPPRPGAPRPGAFASPASSSGPRAKESEKPPPGTFFLGRYRVVDEIGVGGMASVHLARMDGPGGFQKWVAIKRIHPHLVEDDQFVDMFLDEARIAAGINHANVAQVFDLGKDDNTYWIAMEYLHGEPLREVMRRAEDQGQRIGPELAARICADAAEGLHAAHELRGKNGQLLGLVHRDVTPHNLFLTYDGYTKVVDFGIAKVADRLSSTRAGTLKGKLAYMSPEQVRGAEVDRTTDIFALGVVLWEITTNQRLFRMDTDLDTLEKVQACIVPPPSTIVRGYPPELEACVMKALSKRKQDRYQTAREFSRALQTYLMRSGHFVGPEEVAQFVRAVFADRIQKREAHLNWAAEVTSTVNVDKLRSGKGSAGRRGAPGGAGEARASLGGPRGAPLPAHSQTPASGERQRASAPAPSRRPRAAPADRLAVADGRRRGRAHHRRHARAARGPDPPPHAARRRPARAAAGAPAAGAPGRRQPARLARVPARPAVLRGQRRPAPRAPPQPSGGGGGYSAAYANNAQHFGDRTAAMSAPSDDLGSTVALPSNLAMPEIPSASGPRPAPTQALSFGQFGGMAPAPPPNGFGGFPQGGPAPTFGQAQANPALTPAGMVGGVPMHLPVSGGHGGHGGVGGPQSQIETALSLPRPDPKALWMAQQERLKGDRRNTVVLIAVVALTALCVLGIGALVYFKLRARAQSAATPDATAIAAATVCALRRRRREPPPPPRHAAAAPAATATADRRDDHAAGRRRRRPRARRRAAGRDRAKAASGGKEEPGFITIVCNPYCDEVFDQGKSLGPSPIVHLSVPSGSHRITLKKGKDSKVVSVVVVSGQVSAQKISMK